IFDFLRDGRKLLVTGIEPHAERKATPKAWYHGFCGGMSGTNGLWRQCARPIAIIAMIGMNTAISSMVEMRPTSRMPRTLIQVIKAISATATSVCFHPRIAGNHAER